jgi:hypothetical protein
VGRQSDDDWPFAIFLDDILKKVRRLDSKVEAELPTDDADSSSETCEEAKVKSICSDCERQNWMTSFNVHRPTFKADEPTADFQQKRENPQPEEAHEKPKAGRPEDEPEPEPPPINAILSWANHKEVKGMLANSRTKSTVHADSTEKSSNFNYWVEIRMNDKENPAAAELSISGLYAYGNADSFIQCHVYAPKDEGDPRAAYNVNDEFGGATAGNARTTECKNAGD